MLSNRVEFTQRDIQFRVQFPGERHAVNPQLIREFLSAPVAFFSDFFGIEFDLLRYVNSLNL